MTFWKLIRRSLRFHARSHLGVVLGAAIGSAVLIGALVVGDSVKESLRERELSRLGHGSFLLNSGDRLLNEYFPSRIRCESNLRTLLAANRLYQKTSSELPIAINPSLPDRSMLLLNGTVSRGDSSSRVNHVQIIGISDFAPVFFSAVETAKPDRPERLFLTNKIVVNSVIAQSLGVSAGDAVVIRFAKPTSMSAEAAVSPKNQQATTLRMEIQAVTTNAELANFSPVASTQPTANVFVPLNELARAVGLPQNEEQPSLVNIWLAPEVVRLNSRAANRPTKLQKMIESWTEWARWKLNLKRHERDGVPLLPVSKEQQLATLSKLLSDSWDFSNVQIASLLASSNHVSLTSSRIFLDPPIVRAALLADTNAQTLLTYLVNLFRAGTNTTPYSMVTAADAPWTPADMRDDEIVLNQGLADDLQAKPGDEISLAYFDPESGARLVERTNTFRVRGIVPMEMPWADRTLMPDFPGIEKAESTSDWDAGFPLVHKIRPKDEDYWKKYRGTPKAFVTLAAGKKMWANRFGELTAIRFPIPAGEKPEVFQNALEKKILASLKPEELGLRFEPVREQALKAAEQSQDFGQLFLGFSFFIIVAALVLMALLFQFGLEQRTTEIGTLLALGFTQKQVRKLLLREGIVLALIGGAIGALGGIFYAKMMLHGLTTVWRDAVGTSSLQFHASPKTLVIGFFASTVVATLTIWLTLRKQAKHPTRELLVEGGDCRLPIADSQWRGRNFAGVLVIATSFVAAGLIGWAISTGETTNAEIFFSAGALVLIAGLAFASAWLKKLATHSASKKLSMGSFGIRNSSRRRKRTLATISMLACGSFLIVAISAFRLDSNQNATKRSSGTGGFALIGETTIPVVQDLNFKAGKNFFGLDEKDLPGVEFVPFRVHEGDEASCLNLNRAQKPRLLGVKPEMLEERFAFAKGDGWQSLKSAIGNRQSAIEIPAIGDANSIQWALHKKIGDTIDYTDERGNVFKLRLVGAVANSILQGSLIIDEAEFVKRFPGESGYKMFLIDAPPNRVAEVSATLSRAMEDVGLELTPAARRLNEFNAVQNTYLGTFQILGGLGLLLGSAGLGIVVLRNVLERRGELGLLVAVGFRKRALQWMLLSEHGALLGVGLGIGLLAAVVAILPSLISPSAQIPFVSVAITLGAVLLNGALWTWVATRIAVRGNLLAALRNE